MEKLTIVKVGGKIVEEEASLKQLLKDFSSISGNKILVHGGGRSATAMAAKLGVETKMIEGRRITDQEMLNVVTMVYGGLVNKTIVAGLQGNGCNAVGFTGADMDIIRSIKRPVKDIDYGFVGDVIDVNIKELSIMMDQGISPVMAPLTHDGKGQLLNTNADTIASELAAALTERYKVHLIYCFEKDGVLSNPNDDNSVIYELDTELYKQYKTDGTIGDGMIPKLENAFRALNNNVVEVLITNAANLTRPAAKGTVVKL
ncbi:MAG: acetylglutamate kinase [Prolixibacteraceae bacterium]|jgi:acetylglutamate kinase|nr:acetylglutamate kinase [Prolixibacteraceae bacterium]